MMNDEAAIPAEVSLQQLSRKDWAHLIWGIWWRGFVFLLVRTLVGGVVGGVIGAVFGIVAGVSGTPIESNQLPLQITCVVVALPLAYWGYRFYVRWILRARYGSLRLALVREGVQ
jgi:hypothetical protein